MTPWGHRRAPTDPEVRSALDTLSARIAVHPSFSQFSEKQLLMRFLIARKYDVNQAYALWETWCQWKTSYKPEEVSLESVRTELEASHKAEVVGHDKEGRACLIIRLRNHHRGQYPTEDTLRLATYLMEQALAISREKADGYISIIFDLSNIGLNNLDLGLVVKNPGLIILFQEWYAETMRHMFFLHSNFLFRGFYKLCEPFIDDHLKSKIHFLDSPGQLLDYFEPDGLPPDLKDEVVAAAARGGVQRVASPPR